MHSLMRWFLSCQGFLANDRWHLCLLGPLAGGQRAKTELIVKMIPCKATSALITPHN
ncbi:hypothetical protein SAMN04488002_3788 [Litoreibacter janthinus]|uniref:Uncharacterized protein n=1 Tax=Litoreibacter janthinus TaxID=670154 RepID=A0A1I6IFX6_9RHOB|nr:hypothetical protein SAMN04488002_3788 [Litoreibacter janthinus]